LIPDGNQAVRVPGEAALNFDNSLGFAIAEVSVEQMSMKCMHTHSFAPAHDGSGATDDPGFRRMGVNYIRLESANVVSNSG